MNCQSVSGISFVAEMASKKLLETKESYTKIILSVKSDRTVRKNSLSILHFSADLFSNWSSLGLLSTLNNIINNYVLIADEESPLN